MKTSSGLTRRPNIRWKDFDYASDASYFVTICSKDASCTFGTVIDEEVRLSWLGRIVRDEWIATPQLRPGVVLDLFLVMPNHLHAILFVPAGKDVGKPRTFGKRQRGSLGAVIGGFKSAVTSAARRISGNRRLDVWQEGFHDEVIRNSEHLEAVRKYIADNPRHWPQDELFRDT